MSGSIRVLHVEDNPHDRELVRDSLLSETTRYSVLQASTLAEMRELLLADGVEIVLADLHIEGTPNIDALNIVREIAPGVPVIILTGTGSEELAVAAMKNGAADYVIKTPQHILRLGLTIQQVLHRKRLEQEKACAETALAAADKLHTAVLDSMQAATVLLGPDGTICYVNSAWKRFAEENGLNMPGFAVGENYIRVCENASGPSSEEAPLMAAGIGDVLAGRVSEFKIEYSCHSPEIRRWFKAYVTPVDAEPGGAVVVHVDITERKTAEETLLESRQMLKTVLDTIPVRVFWKDREGRYLGCNAPFARDAGAQTPEELAGMHTRDMCWGAQAEQFLADDRQVLDSGIPKLQYEEVQDMPDGTQRLMRTSKVPLKDAAGQVIGVLGAYEDITERKLAEKKVDEATERTRAVFEAASDPMAFLAPDGSVRKCNGAFASLLGRDASSLVGEKCHTLIHLAKDHIPNCPLVRAKSSGRREEMELDVDGRTFLISVDPIRGPDGNATGFVHIMHDLTAYKRAEHALRQSEDRLSMALHASGAGAWIWQIGADRMSWDDAVHVLLQLPVDAREAPFDAFMRVVHREDRGDIRRMIRDTAAADAACDTVFRVVLPDRGIRFIAARGHSVHGADGKPEHVAGLCWDVSEQRRRDREREAVVEISRALRVARTPEEMYPVILEHALRILDADAGLIALHEPGEDDVIAVEAQGRWQGAAGRRWRVGDGIIGRVFATANTYVYDPDSGESGVLYPDLISSFSGVISIPLIASEQVIGVLTLGRRLEFDAPATGIAGSITDMAANAIHRARLFEQIERRVRELDTLRTIDRAITGSLDLEVTLGVLLDQTLARLAADAAAVHLVDQASNRLECAAARGFRTREIWQTRLKMSGGLIADVVANREAFLGPDIGALGTRFKRRSMATVEGFESMAIFPLVSKGAVRGVLEIFCRTKRNFGSEWTGFAESIAGQAAIAIDNALLFNEMERSNVELSIAYDATIEGWSRAMDLRDRETEGHSERVTKLTLRLATAMEVPEEDLVHVRRGALLHDMGKMGIPDAILHKPGPLSDEEWVVMRMHPVYAFELLRPVRYLEQALDIPYCHHERWDGAGYPRGLSGAGIPVAARIFAVVDVWDALSSNRPYRKAWERGRVIEHVRAGAGSHFDPDVVELFLGMVEQDFREGKSG